MSQLNIASHQEIVHFPKDGKPTVIANEWQVWDGEQDEGGIPDLDHGFLQHIFCCSLIGNHFHDDTQQCSRESIVEFRHRLLIAVL